VSVDHSLYHGPHEVIERRRSVFDELGLNHAVNVIDVALVQGNKDCLLVREILVDRADAHPGHLGDPVRGDGKEALTL
jgi:hypothetical protein